MSSGKDPAYVWFVAQLRLARTQKGWSQKELAEKLGRPQSYVSKYETCERRLDFIETARIAAVLELDMVKLLPPGLN